MNGYYFPQVRIAFPEPGLALQGILAGGEPEDSKHNAIVAIANADALLEELAK